MIEEDAVPKICLRVSYNSSGHLNAEIATPSVDKPSEEPTNQHVKSTSKSQSNSKSKVQDALNDMKRGMSARSAAIKWNVPARLCKAEKKLDIRMLLRGDLPQFLQRMKRIYCVNG